jgi:hypothetical protein
MQINGNFRDTTIKTGKVNASEPQVKKSSSDFEMVDGTSIGNNQKEQASAPKKWTILHYGAADNNLKNYLVSDLNEMEEVGSTENMNVISMFDQGGDDCKIYYIEKDDDVKTINSTVLKDMGNTNMADPAVLSEYIVSMTEQFPAENFALILADHGEGWKGGLHDDTSNDKMSLPQMREALDDARKKTGIKLDILGFDACLMAMGEVAYELQDNADFLVSSQALEGAKGWPYTPLLTKDNLEYLEESLEHRIDLPPQEFAEKMIDNAQNDRKSLPTLSLVDLDEKTMNKYAEAVDKFSDALMETDANKYTLRQIRGKTESYSPINVTFRDQVHFCEQIKDDKKITDEKLKEAAGELIDVIREDVVIKNHNVPHRKNSNGLSAEFPGVQGTPPEYQELRFAKDTKWDEAVNELMTNK